MRITISTGPGDSVIIRLIFAELLMSVDSTLAITEKSEPLIFEGKKYSYKYFARKEPGLYELVKGSFEKLQ